MRTTYTKSILVTVIFAFILSSTNMFAGVDPSSIIPKNAFTTFYSDVDVAFHLETEMLEGVFISVTNKANKFNLKTLEDIQFIQLMNSDGGLEFQMPIGSDSVHLSLDNFKSGDYYFNILFNGSEEMTSTLLTIK